MTACHQLSICPKLHGNRHELKCLRLVPTAYQSSLIKIVAGISIAFSRVSADLLGGT